MDLLQEIKNRLCITDDFHNDLINAFANDVKAYLSRAGIPDGLIESERACGIIARGVSDMWINGRFSEMFYQMAIQLRCGDKNV